MHQEKETRRISVTRDVLDLNQRMADENRKDFDAAGVFVLNVMSSPGSGKTTLLQKTLAAIKEDYSTAVVVGDVCTTNDADRLREGGDIPVVQINTEPFGGDCHMTAHLVRDAVEGLDLGSLDILIIENLGNLVCPAEFDVGEHRRAVVLSVTEGEDKPIKYPLMFRVCDAAVLNKIDLIPHLDYDKEEAIKAINQVHSDMPVFETSAKTGEGLKKWVEWIEEALKDKVRGDI